MIPKFEVRGQEREREEFMQRGRGQFQMDEVEDCIRKQTHV